MPWKQACILFPFDPSGPCALLLQPYPCTIVHHHPLGHHPFICHPSCQCLNSPWCHSHHSQTIGLLALTFCHSIFIFHTPYFHFPLPFHVHHSPTTPTTLPTPPISL